VHSLANGPEVTKPLLETSRKGYLAAMSASSYSFVSMMQRFGPIMNPGGAAISLTYIASEDVIPGYGGGMSSAKAVSWGLREGVSSSSCSNFSHSSSAVFCL
jgi:enoyl-[acyl-carrier protein] reductase I